MYYTSVCGTKQFVNGPGALPATRGYHSRVETMSDAVRGQGREGQSWSGEWDEAIPAKRESWKLQGDHWVSLKRVFRFTHGREGSVDMKSERNEKIKKKKRRCMSIRGN